MNCQTTRNYKLKVAGVKPDTGCVIHIYQPHLTQHPLPTSPTKRTPAHATEQHPLTASRALNDRARIRAIPTDPTELAQW